MMSSDESGTFENIDVLKDSMGMVFTEVLMVRDLGFLESLGQMTLLLTL